MHPEYRGKYDLTEQKAWEACRNGQLVTAARTREALCIILDTMKTIY